MIRILFQSVIQKGKVYIEGFCTSLDDKPLTVGENDVVTGSSMYEVDTSDAYLFEEEGKTWIKQGNTETTQTETVQDGD